MSKINTKLFIRITLSSNLQQSFSHSSLLLSDIKAPKLFLLHILIVLVFCLIIHRPYPHLQSLFHQRIKFTNRKIFNYSFLTLEFLKFCIHHLWLQPNCPRLMFLILVFYWQLMNTIRSLHEICNSVQYKYLHTFYLVPCWGANRLPCVHSVVYEYSWHDLCWFSIQRKFFFIFKLKCKVHLWWTKCM